MTDADRGRPEPRWGQYSETPPQYPPPSVPEPPTEEEPEAPRRLTGDIVATTVLLLIGVYDVVSSWPMYASLGASLREAYEFQGFPAFTQTELADSTGAILNVIRAVLLVVAIVWSLARIGRHRRAFWVPLAAGLLAAVIVFGFLFSVMLQDPALMEYIQHTGTPGN